MRSFKSFIICCLIATACSPVQKFQTRPEVVEWEKDIQKLEALDSVEKYPDDAVLFVGSSSIRRWDTIEEDMAPYTPIKRGYGGAKFSDFIVYSKRLIYPHKFQAIVIFIANDITGGSHDKTPKQVLSLFKYTVRQIRGKYPTVPVFFVAITPTESRWKAWPDIAETNRIIASWCKNEDHVFFINTIDKFLNDAGKPESELFVDDQLHLNREGYTIWSSIIKNELGKILK